MYLFTQVFKENETIMTGGVKLRFKSTSYSIDDGFYIAEFLCFVAATENELDHSF